MDFSDMMECSCKLHDAVLEGDIELTKNLLQSQSSSVNEADDRLWNGRTPLHLAALRGRADLVDLLLTNGADPTACDNHGNTPLHWCGHTETIELLVEHGAHVLQCNKRGFTPRDLAERKGVSGSVCNLLCQLELEAKESRDQDHTKDASAGVSHARFSTAPLIKTLRSSNRQTLSGLWQELACELGARKSLLLVLGLLGFSLYIAYILTGLHHGSHERIPIDGSRDNFRVRV